jgi:hypothetical protein
MQERYQGQAERVNGLSVPETRCAKRRSRNLGAKGNNAIGNRGERLNVSRLGTGVTAVKGTRYGKKLNQLNTICAPTSERSDIVVGLVSFQRQVTRLRRPREDRAVVVNCPMSLPLLRARI